ncbi:HAD-IA family hydrolase [Patescibacteria group bacterium]
MSELVSGAEMDYVTPLEERELKKIPENRFMNEQAGVPIELCIWDIGQVILEFSYSFLFDLARKYSSRPDLILQRISTFDYHTYMRGDCDFTQFCMDFCENFEIRYREILESEILCALRKGVLGEIEITRRAVRTFVHQGISNAILSNALSILADEPLSYGHLFPENQRFYSFDMNCLKPEELAWQIVLDRTGVDPENVLFVDDQAKNVQAAIGMGIASILFSPKTFREELRYQLPNTFDHSKY